MNRIRTLAGLATLALIAGTSAAFAAPNAIVTDDFDLRKNPKNSSAPVNFVEEGDLVTITKCQGKWCYAKVPGPDGWIRQDYLAPVDDEGEVYEDEPFSLNFNFGPNGPSISIGNGGVKPVPPQPGPNPNVPQVCFYENFGYAGSSFCVPAGKSLDSLGPQWNDKISSVRVFGGAQAEVCSDFNFEGSCTTWGKNISNVGSWNDVVSSISVY